jgi:hypothetical protein
MSEKQGWGVVIVGGGLLTFDLIVGGRVFGVIYSVFGCVERVLGVSISVLGGTESVLSVVSSVLGGAERVLGRTMKITRILECLDHEWFWCN